MAGSQISNIPNPDPSVITEREIVKARADLRQEFNLLVAGLRESLITRLEAMDKASIVLSENVNRVPTLLDREVATIKGWTVERFSGIESVVNQKFVGVDIKFDSIATQFKERDERIKSADDANKLAIKDAFQAQEKSATAMQANSEKSIEKSEGAAKDRFSYLENGLNDLKDRMTTVETSASASRESRTEHRLDTGQIIAWVIAGIAVLGAIISYENSGRYSSPSLVPGQVGSQTTAIPLPTHQ